MNIGSFLPGLASANTEEVPFEEMTEAEQAAVIAEEKRFNRERAPKHGPSRLRFMTNGQVRRAGARSRKAVARKATASHRREWHKAQQAIAVLRGQLQAVGALAFWDGSINPAPSRDIEEILVENYGSVDAALEAYKALTTPAKR